MRDLPGSDFFDLRECEASIERELIAHRIVKSCELLRCRVVRGQPALNRQHGQTWKDIEPAIGMAQHCHDVAVGGEFLRLSGVPMTGYAATRRKNDNRIALCE